MREGIHQNNDKEGNRGQEIERNQGQKLLKHPFPDRYLSGILLSLPRNVFLVSYFSSNAICNGTLPDTDTQLAHLRYAWELLHDILVARLVQPNNSAKQVSPFPSESLQEYGDRDSRGKGKIGEGQTSGAERRVSENTPGAHAQDDINPWIPPEEFRTVRTRSNRHRALVYTPVVQLVSPCRDDTRRAFVLTTQIVPPGRNLKESENKKEQQ